jgi:hypothetical protein
MNPPGAQPGWASASLSLQAGLQAAERLILGTDAAPHSLQGGLVLVGHRHTPESVLFGARSGLGDVPLVGVRNRLVCVRTPPETVGNPGLPWVEEDCAVLPLFEGFLPIFADERDGFLRLGERLGNWETKGRDLLILYHPPFQEAGGFVDHFGEDCADLSAGLTPGSETVVFAVPETSFHPWLTSILLPNVEGPVRGVAFLLPDGVRVHVDDDGDRLNVHASAGAEVRFEAGDCCWRAGTDPWRYRSSQQLRLSFSPRAPRRLELREVAQ